MAVFGYKNPMGFIPKLFLLKVKYLLELQVMDDVKTDDNKGISDNSKKAMNLSNLMRQYKELALIDTHLWGDPTLFLQRTCHEEFPYDLWCIINDEGGGPFLWTSS